MGMLEFERMLQLELANAERIMRYEATEPAAIPLSRSLVSSVTCVMTSEHGDLFDVGADYALCHCISKDLKMSSGIAVAFKDKFGGLAELRRQCIDVGDVGVLYRDGRYVYYLVTKARYYDKPSMSSLSAALVAMRGHILANGVRRLAMPRIGCGLDRLAWNEVKDRILSTFSDTTLEIQVRTFPLSRSIVNSVTYNDDDHDDDDYDDDQGAQALMAVNQAVDIEVAIDSGSVVHVANPDHLPAHAEVVPNTTGRHFNGANASHIENYGTCLTSMVDKTTGTKVNCDWSVAEVVKPLHAVCKITGTTAAPKHDVLFTAGRAVVVPHGHVDSILRTVKPLMQYDRQGDLFVAKLSMSGFTRQGAKA